MQRVEYPPWRPVSCPGSVRFSAIYKEPQTLGRVYALYRQGEKLLWLGQSLRRLALQMREHYKMPVHCSSGYRVVRKETLRSTHKGFVVERLLSVEAVNELLEYVNPSCIIVMLRDPDNYETAPQPEAEFEAAS